MARRSSPVDPPATASQINYIRSLGGDPKRSYTKGEASALIDALRENPKASPRQQMVLRFYNRTDLIGRSKVEVSAWLDKFYSENPVRKIVWEGFKDSNPKLNETSDPDRIPIGLGDRLLRDGLKKLYRRRWLDFGITLAITLIVTLIIKLPLWIGFIVAVFVYFRFFFNRLIKVRAQRVIEETDD
jgi:hypothetical protein